jgi:hypothetical protein
LSVGAPACQASPPLAEAYPHMQRGDLQVCLCIVISTPLPKNASTVFAATPRTVLRHATCGTRLTIALVDDLSIAEGEDFVIVGMRYGRIDRFQNLELREKHAGRCGRCRATMHEAVCPTCVCASTRDGEGTCRQGLPNGPINPSLCLIDKSYLERAIIFELEPPLLTAFTPAV